MFPHTVLRLLPALLVLVALALPTGAVAAPAAGVTIVRPGDSGPEFLAKELDAARDAGLKVVRTEVLWNRLEPTGSGVTDAAYLAAVDALVDGAAQRGLRVLMLLNGSPCWASTAPDSERAGCPAGGDPERFASYPPRDPSEFGRVAATLAARYTSRLAGIEVWNEPDHVNEVYFKGPDKATRYAQLLRATYRPVKDAAPGVKVLGGAIVGADGRFLKALYDAGIKGHYDALSVHYYDLVLASVRAIRDVQRRNGDTKPLWLSEWGWTSCRPGARRQGGHTCVTPATQARNTVEVLGALRRASYVQGAILFTMHDTTQYAFGILTRGSARKPVFASLRSVLKRPRTVRRPSLSLRVSGGRVVARGSGPAGDAYGLEVKKGGRLRYTATFRLDRDNRYSVRLPRQLGTRGLTVSVRQFWLDRRVTRRR